MRNTFLLIFLVIPTIAFSSPAEEREEYRIPILDTAQELFGAHANFAANRLDSFFATERADDEFGRSRIRIRSLYTLRERAVGDQTNQYRINLKLPHLEQRFQYDFSEANKGEKKTAQQTADEKAQKAKEAELRKLLKQDDVNTNWVFNADMGVSASIPPKLTTRARVRKSFVTGTLIHRFVEQLTYITDANGLIEETQLNSDHVFSENLIFRFINSKQWQIGHKEFSTNHGPTWLHRISDDDAFNYGATLQTIIENGAWFLNNYRFSVDYRRNLYRQWCYLDITPGIDFPKEWSFRRTPFIIFQLELLFGGT